MATDHAAVAADNEKKVNDYLAGASCEWRVQLVGDNTGLHFKIYDSDGDFMPFARLPVTVDGETVRAIENISGRSYDRGRIAGVRAAQQVVCQAIGAKWFEQI